MAADLLTGKQEAFCNEYLVDLNGTKAAIRAGYSENSAAEVASENLRKSNIQAKIAELREKMGKGFNITRERIAQEYARIAFFDIRKVYDADGELIPVTELDEDTAMAISGIEVSNEWDRDKEGKAIITGQLKRIKISEKRAALDSLVKLMGYAEPSKSEITGAGGKAIITETHVKIIRDKASGITPNEFTPQSAGGTGSEETV